MEHKNRNTDYYEAANVPGFHVHMHIIFTLTLAILEILIIHLFTG